MKRKVLIVDDEENMLHMLHAYLSRKGYQVHGCLNGASALKLACNQHFDVILCDLKMPVMDGIEFLRKATEERIGSVIVMMSAFATVDSAVEAMKLGAYDFISKPFKPDELLCVLKRVEELELLRSENVQLREQLRTFQAVSGFEQIVGKSKAITDVISLAQRVAQYDTPVLLVGESGTGKEMFARGIHNGGPRRERPFVAVNCGSIPQNLLESEFFGYVKGAFTGADRDKKGLFAAANYGTLFLDEVAELPLQLQVKLLRVLQEKEVRPLGATSHRAIDVRVIAATAKPLDEEVRSGRFREDLYYRLNVVQLLLPPLRERAGDIRLLAGHFLQIFSKRKGSDVLSVAAEVWKVMEEYHWPGNIRELENAIEYATIYATGNTVRMSDMPSGLIEGTGEGGQAILDTESIKVGRMLLEEYLIRKALEKFNGNKTRAAEALEISYPSLLNKIRSYNLDV